MSLAQALKCKESAAGSSEALVFRMSEISLKLGVMVATDCYSVVARFNSLDALEVID
jgi:hypothetical protein